jgi:flagellar hook protein FlgE
MSVFNALVTGVSGLSAQSQALATISDNIANVNTVGYKRVTTRFTSLVTQSNQQIHSPGGVRSNPFHVVDAQGLLQSTGGQTDIGIEGDGFFIVNANRTPGVGDEYVYTRAGSFNTDNQGFLRNAAGYYLQGWQLDASGNLPANTTSINSLKTINLSNIAGTPKATTNIGLGLNLPANTATASTQNTQITLYDTLGVARNVQLTWTKTANANEWALTLSPSGGSTVGYQGATGAAFTAAGIDGTPATDRMLVTFDANGKLNDIQYDGGTPASILRDEGETNEGKVVLRFNFAPASATQDISFDFGASVANPVTPALADQVSQVGNNYSTNFVNQDGVAPGSYVGVNIANDGTVNALFDNGQTKKVFRVALVDFPAPNGLEARNGNTYAQTERSGLFVLKQPSVGGAGRIAANSVEASTVDIAQEFSNMILTQRAYSANTKVISTADKMLEELIRTIS